MGKRVGLSRKFKTGLIPLLLKLEEGWSVIPTAPMSNQYEPILKTPSMKLHHSVKSYIKLVIQRNIVNLSMKSQQINLGTWPLQ